MSAFDIKNKVLLDLVSSIEDENRDFVFYLLNIISEKGLSKTMELFNKAIEFKVESNNIEMNEYKYGVSELFNALGTKGKGSSEIKLYSMTHIIYKHYKDFNLDNVSKAQQKSLYNYLELYKTNGYKKESFKEWSKMFGYESFFKMIDSKFYDVLNKK